MTIDLQTFRTYALSNMMEVETILSEVYQARCAGRSGFALFDGGAHKAWHTLRMLDLPGCERVHAVEADPFMAETFKDILERKGRSEDARVVFHQKALQNDPRRPSIPWKSSPSHVGRSSIVSNASSRQTIWADNTDIEYRDEFEVPATTIDTILASEPLPLPFLKLDLEGADLLALRGASETLRGKRPVVAFENSIHAPKVHGFTLEEIAEYFSGLGYVPMNFVGEVMTPSTWFGFFEAWLAPVEDADWLSAQLNAALEKRGL